MEHTAAAAVLAAGLGILAVLLGGAALWQTARLKKLRRDMDGVQAVRETAAAWGEGSDTLRRLLPAGLLGALNLKSLSDLSLNAFREMNGVILRADVAGFDRKLRLMDTQRAYELINRIMEGCVPPVYENGGEIIDFVNGGFEALFLSGYAGALGGAVTMCEYVREQEREHGEYKDFGIGICYGPVMAGVVGHPRRMALSMLSVYTGFAAFLQSIAGKYYARILVTGNYAQLNGQFDRQFHYRLLGYISVRSANTVEKIYDVFDGDPVEVRNQKRRTKTAFEKGVKVFAEGDFPQARVCFIEVLKTDQQDLAARRYVHLCEKNLEARQRGEADIYIEAY
ncbi:MAG: hypothetical protein KH230_21050 [Enterocloster asparagiformis]|nr:hypothetical protein [Enterocloster asparagiformis]